LETQQDIDDCRTYFGGVNTPSKITFGGAVNVMGNAGSASATLDEVKKFFERCKRNDECPIIYYTGHGNDQGNWCFPRGTISFEEIVEANVKSGANLVTLLCDCCHAGEWVYRSKTHKENVHVVGAAGGSRQDKNLAYNRVFAQAAFKKEEAARSKLYSDSRAISTKKIGSSEVTWFTGFKTSWLEP
jgi:hypothetical protein